jgi:hypothetical protein
MPVLEQPRATAILVVDLRHIGAGLDLVAFDTGTEEDGVHFAEGHAETHAGTLGDDLVGAIVIVGTDGAVVQVIGARDTRIREVRIVVDTTMVRLYLLVLTSRPR